MSIYGKNYKKVNDGYNKIMDTIDSIKNPNQLPCIPRMFDSWLDLVDLYCNDVFNDKTNKHHKKDADSLAYAAKDMFEDMKDFYQYKTQELEPEEYTGVFKNVRIKTLNEFIYE